MRAQEGLKQALVSVAVHVETPFLHQPNTRLQVFSVAEQAYEDVDGGDVATYVGAVHVAEDRPGEVEPGREGGLGENEEEAVAGEGVMVEIRGKRGTKPEESNGEVGAVEGFQDFGGFR